MVLISIDLNFPTINKDDMIKENAIFVSLCLRDYIGYINDNAAVDVTNFIYSCP